MTQTITSIEAAAHRLRAAARSGTPCTPVRDLLEGGDTQAAYAVQRLNVAERLAAGARVVGRKIGLTSPAVQRQLGVDQPDFGVLLDAMDVSGSRTVPLSGLLQPKVEAEVAFVLSADLDRDDLNARTVRAAVDHARPALEIVDSRIDGWDITFLDTVADNASSGLFVLGASRVTLDRFEPRDCVMEMTADGAVVSTGTGAACLGGPLAALAWLARTAHTLGYPLRAGEVVLSGALGPMWTVRPGATVRGAISGLGRVEVVFT